MRVLVLSAFMFFFALNSFSQEEPISVKETHSGEVYCMVMAQQRLLSTKVTISVDYGQAQNYWKGGWRGERMRDEEGKLQKFNSVIDALNYMSEQGWSFVNAYVVTVNQQNVYHYVMRRKLSDEELRDMENPQEDSL